jgi:hypothetical protein
MKWCSVIGYGEAVVGLKDRKDDRGSHQLRGRGLGEGGCFPGPDMETPLTICHQAIDDALNILFNQ